MSSLDDMAERILTTQDIDHYMPTCVMNSLFLAQKAA